MPRIWIETICAGCGEALLPKDKSFAVLPTTITINHGRHGGLYRPDGDYYSKSYVRLMKRKGRKGGATSHRFSREMLARS